MQVTKSLVASLPNGKLFNADSKEYGYITPFVVSLQGKPLCFASDHIFDAEAFIKASIRKGDCTPTGWTIMSQHHVDASHMWEGYATVVDYDYAKGEFFKV